MLPPFQMFLDEHREAVYRLLIAVVGRDEAEDCFQETFLAALRAYPRLHDGSNLRAWALTIAMRKAIDARRRRARRPLPMDSLPEAGSSSGVEDADPALWASVRALPTKQRAAVVYRFVNDLPYAQIGQILGCSEEAARQNVREGLKKLKGVGN